MAKQWASEESDADVLDRLTRGRIIPVAVIPDVTLAGPLATALVEGGLPVVEVTFRTSAAVEAIRVMAEDPRLLVGAGTVLNADQVDAAVCAGAEFVVSPGFSPEVVRRCGELGVAVVPGAVTATEIQRAREAGVRTVKFFPAETAGGSAAIRALSAPFGDMRFIPTGGIGPGNLKEYLDIPGVRAVGGSWMLPSDAVAGGDVATLRRHVAATVRAALQ